MNQITPRLWLGVISPLPDKQLLVSADTPFLTMSTLRDLLLLSQQHLSRGESYTLCLHSPVPGVASILLACLLVLSDRFCSPSQVHAYLLRKECPPSQQALLYSIHLHALLDSPIRACQKFLRTVTVDRVPAASYHGHCRLFLQVIKADSSSLLYSSEASCREEQHRSESSVLNSIQVALLSPTLIQEDVILRLFHKGKFFNVLLGECIFNTGFQEDNALTLPCSDFQLSIQLGDSPFESAGAVYDAAYFVKCSHYA